MNQPSQPPTARDAVDLQVLRDATGGDRDLMQELAALYLNDSDLQLRALEDALENQEMDRLRRVSQALCASSDAIGAMEAARIFRELDAAARSGDVSTAGTLIEQGVQEFDRVKRCLVDLR